MQPAHSSPPLHPGESPPAAERGERRCSHPHTAHPAPRGCLHIQSVQSFQGSGAPCDSIPGWGRAAVGWGGRELQRVCAAGLSTEPALALAVLGGSALQPGNGSESIPMASRMHSPALASRCVKAGAHRAAPALAQQPTPRWGQGSSPHRGQAGTGNPTAACSPQIHGSGSCSRREAGRDSTSLRHRLTLFHKQFVKA